MARERALTLRIASDSKAARRDMAGLSKDVDKAGKQTEKTVSRIKGSFLDLGVAAGAAFAFNEWNEAEKVGKQTAAVIESTGNAAQTSVEHVEDLSEAIMDKTAVDDEQVQSSANALIGMQKFRNEAGKGRDVLDRLTAASVDWAASSGGDSIKAAQSLGRFVSQGEAGMAKLVKAGVVFTDQEREKVRVMQATGDEIGVQMVLLDAIERKVGGSAAAQATGYDRAKTSAGNLAETVGGVLAPAIERGAAAAENGAKWFQGLDSWQQNLAVSVALGGYTWLRWGDNITDALGTLRTFGAGARRTAKDIIVPTSALEGLGSTAEGTGRSFSKMRLAAQAAGLLAVGVAAVEAGNAINDKYFKTIVKVEDALAGTNDEIVGVANELEKASDQFDENMFTSIGESDITALYAMRDALGDAYDPASNLGKAIADLEASQKAASERADTYSGAVAALDGTLEEVTGTTDGARKSNYDLEASLAAARDRYAEVEEEASAATQAIKDYWDESTNAVSTQMDVEAALDAVTQSIKDNGLALSISGPGGRANREAMIAAKDDALEYAMSIREQTGSSEMAAEAMNTYAGSLRQTLIDGGFTEEQVNSLIAEMKLTPADIATTFLSNATEEELKVKAVGDSIKALPGWGDEPATIRLEADTSAAQRSILILASQVNELTGNSATTGLAGMAIDIYESQNAPQAPAPSGTPKRKGWASGGRAGAGEWGWVGEKGPELVEWGANARVYPTDKSMAMAGGGRGGNTYVTVNVQGTVITERDLASGVARVLNAETRATGRAPVIATQSNFRR